MNEKDISHIVLDAEESLAKAISDIEQTSAVVIVTKNGKYFGLIGASALRQLSDDPNLVKAGHVCVSAPCITDGTALLERCKLFFTTRFKALPFIMGDELKGVVRFSDLLSELVENNILDGKYVKDVMSSPGVRVEVDASLAQAQTIMRKNHIRRLIVTDNGSLSGVLSTYDIAHLLRSPKERLPEMKQKISRTTLSVKTLMQKKVATINSDKSLNNAADEMISNNVASLVVVDGEKVAGIITVNDILETVFTSEGPNINISGLYGENKDIYPEVIAVVEKEMDKIKRTENVEYVTLHFKFHRKRCMLKIRMKAGKMFSVSASDYGIIETVKQAMKELEKVTKKKHEKKRR